jgi:acid phosphatase
VFRLNPSECNKVVPFQSLSADLASAATTPNFVWVTPNMCNDTHDCSVSTGDSWLSHNVPAILNSPAFTQQRSLLMITWDEDNDTQGNQVPMLVVAKGVPAGFRSSAAYDHYSYLRTIEASWGLSALTANDAGASPMSDFFGPSPSPSPSPSPAPPPSPSPSPSPSPTESPTPPPSPSATTPDAPTVVRATARRKASASVSWTPPANDGGCSISGYTVTSSPEEHTAHVSGSATSAKLRHLTPGTTYTFTVMATNCAGDGPGSAPSNAIRARK